MFISIHIHDSNIATAEFLVISAETTVYKLGNTRKKIAKLLMRTFTCCSTFLYALHSQLLSLSLSVVVCDVRTCSRIPDLETAGRRRAGTAGAAKRQPLLCL